MKFIRSTHFSYFLFFLTFFSLFGQDRQNGKTECPNRKRYQYLNLEKIKELSEKECTTDKKSCPIRVRCYGNGLWYACPNPHDAKRCEGVEESYNRGSFFEIEDIPLTEEAFCDDKNWNS